MRLTFAAIVMMAVPAVAVAQLPARAWDAFPALPPIGLPLGPIGLPLGPIGLPLPSIGLAPVHDATSRMRGGQASRGDENRHTQLGSRRHLRSASTVIVYVPTYGWGSQPAVRAATLTASGSGASMIDPPQARSTGSISLDVHPSGGLQIYVDGYYVGTSIDVNGELELEAGPHTIEVRAPGYETLTFDVKITQQRSITYRGALKPVDVEPNPPATVRLQPDPLSGTPQLDAPVVPTTIYLIPGCYLGNVPPEDVALPAGCDLSRLVTRKP